MILSRRDGMGSFGLCGYMVEMIAMCWFSFSVFYFFDCSYAAKITWIFDRYRQIILIVFLLTIFRLLNGLTPACWCYLVAAVPIQRPVGLQEKERGPLFIYRKCRRRSWCICSLISLPIIWRKWFHSSNDRRRWKPRIPDHGRSIDCYIIENAPQVCCLATRLRGLLSLVSKNFLKSEYKSNAHFWILPLFFPNHKGCFSQSLGNPIYYTSRKLAE